MKPIFAIDLTNDKKNDKTNGDEFIVRTVSSYATERYEESKEELKVTFEKAKLPRPLRITKTICLYVWAFVLAVTVRLIVDNGVVNFSQFYGNAPYVFWAGGAAFVAWIILSIKTGQINKEVLNSNEAENTANDFKQNLDNVYAELGVPEDAASVEILCFRYVLKKGEISVKSYPLSTCTHANVDVVAFVEDGNLCIADVEHRYEFPLSEITGIRLVNKKIIMPCWNKDEEHTSPKYKQYKIWTDKYGSVYAKNHYVIEIDHFGENFGLYFPPYELPIFEKLTGLKAEEVK